MDAIIYKSNTGTTAKYAELLGVETGLPVHEISKANGVEPNAEIIYLGWLMAGEIKGYKQADKKWTIRAACGVGMSATGTQIQDVRKRNKISEKVPVFTLQGGFYINKLHGLYKFMMKVMIKIVGKKLAAKTDRTQDEDVMYDMIIHGGDYVSIENLKDVLAWYSISHE
ncbi:hypothetical protein SAMN02745248_01258 [Hathewaya proteolytica DSM 3090]|uniref:Flavodoxin domain-containing protein n=1 Tax=Hathewaya proteolytica DSM 3090 TaxID=1121331 RepID=A0A1M6N414_9CLOT|nr:hypothetical protein [Hathewaya proteolytica]SHJ90402.1 hypothetical protein SAMN02745248_01258 [Hathewaya proteolytica DSM 3090]